MTKELEPYDEYCRRKANQHWEMAGLARQDKDYEDEARHVRKARRYEQYRRHFLGFPQKEEG